MKQRQVSICIFLAVIVIVIILVYVKISNANDNEPNNPQTEATEQETTENNQSVTISQEYNTYYFYAKDDAGRVSIYDMKSQTLYMETSIETDMLPEILQKELESGIYFKTEMELYDFLESYSS